MEAPATRLDRRRFLAGTVTGGIGMLGAAGLVGYDAFAHAPYEPVLERIDLSVPAEQDHLSGLTIGFLADTHLGPAMGEEDVARATDLLASESPDLILLGGDYISASPRYAEPVARILGDLVSRAPFGGVAVLGNHDCGERGRDRIVTEALERFGIPVLRNQARGIDTGRGMLWIAGVDEALMARSDPFATFSQVPREAAPLALWHEPDYARQTARLGAFAQLSGHSHGGQVRIPGIGPLFLPRGGVRYPIGFNTTFGMPVYTSRGVGVYLPAIRFNCPPEVTLITLVAP